METATFSYILSPCVTEEQMRVLEVLALAHTPKDLSLATSLSHVCSSLAKVVSRGWEKPSGAV